jgi:hypothetical protein
VSKPAVTARAECYPAQKCIARPEKICVFCGARKNLLVGHVNGDEADGEAANVVFTCRSCNSTIGLFMARAGFGRRMTQDNPVSLPVQLAISSGLKATLLPRANAVGGARSLGQWMVAVMSMKGSGPMKLADAVAMVRATSPAKRSEYAREIWRLRRAHGTDRTAVPF